MALLDDPSMFEEGYDAIPVSETLAPFFYDGETIRSKKRVQASYACKYCGLVSPEELVFDIGCTHECALSYLYYNNFIIYFDVACAETLKASPFSSRQKCACVLPEKLIHEDTETFWKRVLDGIYHPDDDLHVYLREKVRRCIKIQRPASQSRGKRR